MPPIVQKITLQRIGRPEDRQTFSYIDEGTARVLGLSVEGYRFMQDGRGGVRYYDYEGGAPDYRLWTLTDGDRLAAEEEAVRAAAVDKETRLLREQTLLRETWGDFAQQTRASMHELFPSVFSAES